MSDELSLRTALLAECNTGWGNFWTLLKTASAAASAFHGYRRNNESLGWAVGWGLLGYIIPVVVPVVGAAQGFAKPKGGPRG
jgi:hypothetical protein